MAEDAKPAGPEAFDEESAKLLNLGYAALRKATNRPVRGIVVLIVAEGEHGNIDLTAVSGAQKHAMLGLLEETKMMIVLPGLIAELRETDDDGSLDDFAERVVGTKDSG